MVKIGSTCKVPWDKDTLSCKYFDYAREGSRVIVWLQILQSRKSSRQPLPPASPNYRACERARKLVAHLPFRHLGEIRPGVSPPSLLRFTVAATDKWGVIITLGCNYDARVLAADGTVVVICQWRQRGMGRGRKSDNGDRLLIRSVTKGGGDLTNKECLRWQQRTTEFQLCPSEGVYVCEHKTPCHDSWPHLLLNHFRNPALDVYCCWMYMALLSAVHFKQKHQTWPHLILLSMRDLVQGNVFFFLFLCFQQRIITKQFAGYK